MTCRTPMGIEHELTCAGTSHQNGKAERHIRILFSTMRTLLSDARLPPNMWAEAMCCATYVHNRTLGPSGSTPFELRYGRAPAVSHLRPFGCSCTITVEPGSQERPDKARPAAILGTLLGYGYVSGQKGYRIMPHGSRSVITSTNVRFGDFDAGVLRRAEQVPDLYTTPADLARLLLEIQHARTVGRSPSGAEEETDDTHHRRHCLP